MQKFYNDFNKVLNERGTLEFVCLDKVDAERLVRFLNNQEVELENVRKANRRVAYELERGW